MKFSAAVKRDEGGDVRENDYLTRLSGTRHKITMEMLCQDIGIWTGMFLFPYIPFSVTKPASATWVGHQGFPPSEKDLVTKFLATLCLESLADKT